MEKLFAAVSHLEDVAVVGVVESWPTTVDLLEKVLDATGAVPALWDRYRAARRTKNKAKTDVNPRDVVAAFRADPDFWAAAQQFLRFENAFYVAGPRANQPFGRTGIELFRRRVPGPRRPVAATPRAPRGYAAETCRGGRRADMP